MAPCFKKSLRLEAGYPALRCHNLNNQQVTRTQHTRQKQKRHRTATHQKHSHTHGGGTPPHPRDLNEYRRGLVSSPKFIRDRNIFSAEQKASKQLQERRAVKEDELHAELEQQVQRDEAAPAQPPAAAGSWRTSGARSSSSGSMTWRCTWHSASSRTCAEIRQRRQHQGQAHQAPG